MGKKAFVVMACKPREISEYIPKLVILAKDREEALRVLKERGLEYHVDARLGDGYITYHWYMIETSCELVELPLLDTEKVLA